MTKKQEEKEVQEKIELEMEHTDVDETLEEVKDDEVTEEDDLDVDDEAIDELVDDKKKKEAIAKKDRQLALYGLACDVSNLEVNKAERENYANTVLDMGDNNFKNCDDGVQRSTQYYREQLARLFWICQYQEVNINKLMIERGVTVDELNAFMKEKVDVYNGKKKTTPEDEVSEE